jgi:hypothetical protein
MGTGHPGCQEEAIRVRVAPSIAAIVPWKVASAGPGGLAVEDPGGLDEFQDGEPEGAAVMVPADVGATVAPSEQAPARKDAAKQNTMVMLGRRLALTTFSVGRSGNSVVSPG